MSPPFILAGIVRKSIIIIDTIPSSLTDNLCLLLVLYRWLKLHLLAWNSFSSSHPFWCVLFATIPTFVDEPWSSTVLSFIIIWPLAILVSLSASIANTDVWTQQTYHIQHIFMSPDLFYKSHFSVFIEFQSIPPVFHHPFDRQSSSIFNSGLYERKVPRQR